MEQDRRIFVGLIGGIGPKSTSLFVQKLINSEAITKKKTPPFMLYTNTDVDVSGPNALSQLQDTISVIKQTGVTHIGMICNTAHKYINQLRESFPSLTFIDMIGSVCKLVEDSQPKGYRAALVGTKGVCSSDLFTKYLKKGTVVVPDQELVDHIDKLTFSVLSGNMSDVDGVSMTEKFTNIMLDLKKSSNVDVFILACTDLTAVLNDLDHLKLKGLVVVDPLDILTKCVLDLYQK
ncbi:amino-acid racemase [Acrasis kona]|uniref:Amino-acid racemase n=1 Tax=Acrasis kona TaxID=1008807 RepID=A0AAW2YLR7_9EUKA